MPNQIDDGDALYRMVKPPHVHEDGVSPDAYDDKYEEQSFNLASVSSPKATLEKFARYDGTRKACKKKSSDPNPTYLEMYDAGYRVTVHTVECIVEEGLTFLRDENANEYDNTGHVNVVRAKDKAGILAEKAHVLTRQEMIDLSL